MRGAAVPSRTKFSAVTDEGKILLEEANLNCWGSISR